MLYDVFGVNYMIYDFFFVEGNVIWYI